jgi:hypothetical protein
VTSRRPAEYSYAPEEEIPTKPEAVDPSALLIFRLCDTLAGPERQRVARLLKAWQKCTLDQQIILEALARELAPPDS